MSQWISNGTVAVTTGSATVTGTGTGWDERYIIPGYAFVGPDGNLYEVQQVISANVISLSKPYTGATNATGTYDIIQMSYAASRNILEQIQTLLAAWASSVSLSGNLKVGSPVETAAVAAFKGSLVSIENAGSVALKLAKSLTTDTAFLQWFTGTVLKATMGLNASDNFELSIYPAGTKVDVFFVDSNGLVSILHGLNMSRSGTPIGATNGCFWYDILIHKWRAVENGLTVNMIGMTGTSPTTVAWGLINGGITDQVDLMAALNAKASKAVVDDLVKYKSTFTTFSALKAADTSLVKIAEVYTNGLTYRYLWSLSDYTVKRAAETPFEIFYVKADAVAVTAGCWVLDLETEEDIDAELYGVKADFNPLVVGGGTDNAAALNKLADMCWNKRAPTKSGNANIVLPDGNVKLLSKWVLRPYVSVRGRSKDGTVLWPVISTGEGLGNDGVIVGEGVAYENTIKDFAMRGDYCTGDGKAVEFVGTVSATFKDVLMSNLTITKFNQTTSPAVVLRGNCYAVRIDDLCKFDDNTKHLLVEDDGAGAFPTMSVIEGRYEGAADTAGAAIELVNTTDFVVDVKTQSNKSLKTLLLRTTATRGSFQNTVIRQGSYFEDNCRNAAGVRKVGSVDIAIEGIDGFEYIGASIQGAAFHANSAETRIAASYHSGVDVRNNKGGASDGWAIRVSNERGKNRYSKDGMIGKISGFMDESEVDLRARQLLSELPLWLSGSTFDAVDLRSGVVVSGGSDARSEAESIAGRARTLIAPATALAIDERGVFAKGESWKPRQAHLLDGTAAGALFEPSKTYRNKQTSPTLAEWTLEYGGITSVASPAGWSGPASRFPATATGGGVYQSIAVIAGDIVHISTLVRMLDGSLPVLATTIAGAGDFSLYFEGGLSAGLHIDTAAAGAKVTGPFRNDVYRIDGYAVASATGTFNFGVDRRAAQSGKGFDVLFFQVGDGRYPARSLYENITATPNTRSSDVLTIPISDYSGEAAGLAAEFIAPSNRAEVRFLGRLGDDPNNYFGFYYPPNSDVLTAEAFAGGILVWSGAVGTTSPGIRYRVAAAMDPVQKKIRAKLTGAAAINTTVTASGVIAGLDGVEIGHIAGTGQLQTSIAIFATSTRAPVAKEIAAWVDDAAFVARR
jgi:hypothetical protein